jgi:hypothetical protein
MLPSLEPGRVLATFGTEQQLPWRSTATTAELELPQMNADSVRENLVYRIFLQRSLADGSFPWWSPYWFGGMPFVASGHTQALYPPSVIAAFFDPLTSYGALIAFHGSVAAGGAWLWLRAAGLGRLACFLGSLVFLWNGMFVTRHGQPQFIATGAWLPWILAGIEHLCGSRRALGTALVAIATALAILAGHPSVYIYGLYFIGAYALVRALFIPGPSGARLAGRYGARALVAAAGAVAIGAGLASVQLAALLELAATSERAVTATDVALERLPHWLHLLRALFPDAAGTPLRGDYWTLSKTKYFAGILYVGVAPLVLALVGALRGGARGRWLALIGAGAVAVIYLPPLAAAAHSFLPGFQFSRIDRLSIAWFLSVPMLVGLGLEALLRGERTLRAGAALIGLGGLVALGLWAFPHFGSPYFPGAAATARAAIARGTVYGVLAIGALAWAGRGRPRRRPAALLLIALSALELASFARAFIVDRDADRMFRETSLTRFLEEVPGPFRIAKFAPTQAAIDITFPANIPAVYGIEDLHGFGPLHSPDIDRLLRAVDERPVRSWAIKPFFRAESLASPVVDLLQVRYVLSAEPLREPGSIGLRLVHDEELHVYENDSVMPRATFVVHYVVEPDPTRAAALIASGDVDPRSSTVLERAPPGLSARPPTRGANGRVEILDRGLDWWKLRKSGPQAGLVRLADPFYAGWTASVDGEAAPVLRADSALRAVAVGPGQHEIVFRYRPAWLEFAVGTTLVSMLALTLALFATSRAAESVEVPSAKSDTSKAVRPSRAGSGSLST